MRSKKRLHEPTSPRCHPCTAGIDHCHGTLVLHADGTAECDEHHHCEAREDLHEWWVPCIDLGCGCTGDEHPNTQLLMAA